MDVTLLDDWKISLTVRNLAPRTVSSYVQIGTAYARWCGDRSGLTRRDLQTYLAHLTVSGAAPGYIARTYRELQQFFKFLVHEEIINVNPFDKMTPPVVPEKPVPLLTTDEVRKLLDACKGRGFAELRDTALIRLLLDTGLRCSELVGIEIGDLDLATRSVVVTGKGRRDRIVVFGDRVAEALRRYLRARNRYSSASLPQLWIGKKGAITTSGVRQILRRRGDEARVEHLHPHRFRHQFAHDWMSAGGNETDLMRLAGWKSRQMVSRYGASAAVQRAHEAHSRINLSAKY